MKTTNVKMTCRKCGTENEISVDELLIRNFEQSIKSDLENEFSKRESELQNQKNKFEKLSEQLAQEKEEVDKLVNLRVKTLLQQKQDSLKESIRNEINEERSKELQELENELVKKSEQLKEFNGTKAQLSRLRREMEEAETRIILEKDEELTKRLEEARLTIKEQMQQESFLKLREREKVIEDLKIKLDEAKRQAEQGSMQMQGEVLELFLENILRNTFHTDEIIEVKKGECGADCIQKVKTNSGVQIGSIIWETKNTQSFSNGWISKLKSDNLIAKADVMIIVTAAMPKEITGKFGIKDGVWICSKESIIDLSLALRFGMLKVQSILLTNQGRESKQQLLFDFLTSENFKNTFESILDSFKKIQDSHHSEKIKMQRLWAERQKLLEQALASTVEFYGTIKGISSAIPEVQLLEFRKAV